MKQCSMIFNSDIEFLLFQVDDDTLLLFAREADWEGVRERLEQIWHGDRSDHLARRKPFDAVLMCKISILGVRHNTSVFQVQEGASDRLSWRRFRKLRNCDRTSAERTIGEYRSRLVHSGQRLRLFGSYTAEMKAAGSCPNAGQMMDAGNEVYFGCCLYFRVRGGRLAVTWLLMV